MRSLLFVVMLALGVAVAGCCKKSSSDSSDGSSAKNTPVPTHTTTARPCSGMVTDKDCQACCGAGYRSSFRGQGTCTCFHLAAEAGARGSLIFGFWGCRL